MISIIVPARDEARNLGRCLDSLRALRNVDVEILVVEGGSTDGTRAIAEAAAREDPRVRVLDEPPLPAGWVGKPWACWNGAQAARGAWLLFTDADTWHAPESLATTAELARDADLLTGLTRQELGTFAERVAMPPVFLLIRTAAGGAAPERFADPEHAIANGQYLLWRREAYERLGGHEAVKGSVIEDLALARLAARARLRGRFEDLTGLVAVRMYRGWGDMLRGWRKNVATGATVTPPLAFAKVALLFLAGLLALPAALGAVAAGVWWLAAACAALWLLVAWGVRGAAEGAEGPRAWHALLHPVGFAFFGVVLTLSVWDRVSGRGPGWKGRRYPSR